MVWMLVTIIAIVAASSSTHACSSRIRQDAEGTVNFVAVHKGGLRKASTMLCARCCNRLDDGPRRKVIPGHDRDDADGGGPAGIVKLHGCTIGKMILIAGTE